MAVFAPRVSVHSDRYGSTKTHGPNLWAVLHTSEQSGESTTSAEALARYMTSPGDRPNGRGGYYGSSYQAIFDTDQIIPCVPNNVVAYAAGGGNSQGIHGCFPGKAGQSRRDWLDAVSSAQIAQAATWLVHLGTTEGIPLRFITPAQVRAGEAGICDHHAISLAFGKSTHTDVGPSFPWDILRREIDALVTPSIPNPPDPEDDDMKPTCFYRDTKIKGTFACVGGRWVPWLFEPTGAPVHEGDHPYTREQVLFDQGERAADLWRERMST